jgi:hypothetical protein
MIIILVRKNMAFIIVIALGVALIGTGSYSLDTLFF